MIFFSYQYLIQTNDIQRSFHEKVIFISPAFETTYFNLELKKIARRLLLHLQTGTFSTANAKVPQIDKEKIKPDTFYNGTIYRSKKIISGKLSFKLVFPL